MNRETCIVCYDPLKTPCRPGQCAVEKRTVAEQLYLESIAPYDRPKFTELGGSEIDMWTERAHWFLRGRLSAS